MKRPWTGSSCIGPGEKAFLSLQLPAEFVIIFSDGMTWAVPRVDRRVVHLAV